MCYYLYAFKFKIICFYFFHILKGVKVSMTLDDIIFIDSLPKLDLHCYDRETARVAINDFINDMLKQKINIFVIVHGNGEGIIRETAAKTLKANRNVIEYKVFYYNTGSTLVRIKV